MKRPGLQLVTQLLVAFKKYVPLLQVRQKLVAPEQVLQLLVHDWQSPATPVNPIEQLETQSVPYRKKPETQETQDENAVHSRQGLTQAAQVRVELLG